MLLVGEGMLRVLHLGPRIAGSRRTRLRHLLKTSLKLFDGSNVLSLELLESKWRAHAHNGILFS